MSEREPGLGQTAFGNPFRYLVLPVEQCLQPKGSLDMYVCSLDFMHLPVFCKLVGRLTQSLSLIANPKKDPKNSLTQALHENQAVPHCAGLQRPVPVQ